MSEKPSAAAMEAAARICLEWHGAPEIAAHRPRFDGLLDEGARIIDAALADERAKVRALREAASEVERCASQGAAAPYGRLRAALNAMKEGE